MAADFPNAFASLRAVLKRHSEGMIVLKDAPTDFTLLTRAIGPNNQPMWFGSVQLKKSAVTYHLMPLYFNPVLQSQVPKELLARKQGKTCFNFQRPDPDLFKKLDALTQLAREHYERHGFLEPGPVPQERFAAALRAGGVDTDALARLRKSKGRQAAAKRAATIAKRRKQKSASPARSMK